MARDTRGLDESSRGLYWLLPALAGIVVFIPAVLGALELSRRLLS